MGIGIDGVAEKRIILIIQNLGRIGFNVILIQYVTGHLRLLGWHYSNFYIVSSV